MSGLRRLLLIAPAPPQAVFEGLAQDGGLLIPHFVPDVSNEFKKWKNHSFDELAYEIAKLYVGDEVCSRCSTQIYHLPPNPSHSHSLPVVADPQR